MFTSLHDRALTTASLTTEPPRPSSTTSLSDQISYDRFTYDQAIHSRVFRIQAPHDLAFMTKASQLSRPNLSQLGFSPPSLSLPEPLQTSQWNLVVTTESWPKPFTTEPWHNHPFHYGIRLGQACCCPVNWKGPACTRAEFPIAILTMYKSGHTPNLVRQYNRVGGR